MSGLEKWQSHTFRRAIPAPPTVWSNGSSKLLDFGGTAPTDQPLLVIPSLINRAYILDLCAEHSLLRYLAANGLRPFLLDWGAPTTAESHFGFEEYINNRLVPALKIVGEVSGTPPAILGHCMGGTLAAGVLATSDIPVSAFATIGSPWDFGKLDGTAKILRQSIQNPAEILDSLNQNFGMIPADFFQYLFALIEPETVAKKFIAFDQMDYTSTIAERFVAIEDWLADAVPMSTLAAKNLLIDWNFKNQTACGTWELNGQSVDLGKITQPTFVICGKKDRIAPLGVAKSMAQIPDARLLTPDLGHIGMIVSERAKSDVWQPLAQFLRNNITSRK